MVAPPHGAVTERASPAIRGSTPRATARALGVELPDLDAMLRRLRAEVESSWSLA